MVHEVADLLFSNIVHSTAQYNINVNGNSYVLYVYWFYDERLNDKIRMPTIPERVIFV